MTIGVNLIPARLQWRRQLRRRRAAWIAGAATYAALLAAGCVGWRVAFVTPPAALGDEIQRTRHDADERSAELTKLRASLAEHRAALRISEALAARPDWSNLLALVSHACGSDVVLKRCDIAAPGELPPPDRRPEPVKAGAPPALKPPELPRAVLRIEGIAPSQVAVSRFALRLEQVGVFDSIDPSSNRETFDGSDAVAFRLDCWLATSANAAPHRPVAHAANDITGVTP